jgi:repressor LexA
MTVPCIYTVFVVSVDFRFCGRSSPPPFLPAFHYPMDSSKTIASSSLPLTDRQRKVLDWIRGHLESTGMPPTRAEIASGLGFRTASSAEDHVRALARKGALELTPGASRGLRLKDMPELRGARGTPGSRESSQMSLPGLPVVGRVAAGSPILATEHIEAHVRVDPALFTPRADYLLRVRGHSMRDAGILDGDLLAVHGTAEARSGQIVVARLSGPGGDEVTVKRLKRRGREIMLVAENPDFAPIVIDPKRAALTIEGLAVGLVRGGKGW